MSKVTAKLQLTLPKAIAKQYQVAPGDEIDLVPDGDQIRILVPSKRSLSLRRRNKEYSRSLRRDSENESESGKPFLRLLIEAGPERRFILVAALIDTSILIYRYDERFPEKQNIATWLLSQGLSATTILIPHQALIEFVSVCTRPMVGKTPILSMKEACREVEEILSTFPVLYPNESILRTALLGMLTYQLSWFDAHLWAYAECNGISKLGSEDFQHGRFTEKRMSRIHFFLWLGPLPSFFKTKLVNPPSRSRLTRRISKFVIINDNAY